MLAGNGSTTKTLSQEEKRDMNKPALVRPNDPVTLRQMYASWRNRRGNEPLHHILNGEIWSVDEIQKRKAIVEEAGLEWSVVERYLSTKTSKPTPVSTIGGSKPANAA